MRLDSRKASTNTNKSAKNSSIKIKKNSTSVTSPSVVTPSNKTLKKSTVAITHRSGGKVNSNDTESQDYMSVTSDGGTRTRVKKSMFSARRRSGFAKGDSDTEGENKRMRPKMNKNADLSSSEDMNVVSSKSGGHLLRLNSENRLEAPDYNELAEKKNMVTLFDTYLQIFETMISIEPKLFKDAVKTIK